MERNEQEKKPLCRCLHGCCCGHHKPGQEQGNGSLFENGRGEFPPVEERDNGKFPAFLRRSVETKEGQQ